LLSAEHAFCRLPLGWQLRGSPKIFGTRFCDVTTAQAHPPSHLERDPQIHPHAHPAAPKSEAQSARSKALEASCQRHATGNEVPSPSHPCGVGFPLRQLADLLAGWLSQRQVARTRRPITTGGATRRNVPARMLHVTVHHSRSGIPRYRRSRRSRQSLFATRGPWPPHRPRSRHGPPP